MKINRWKFAAVFALQIAIVLYVIPYFLTQKAAAPVLIGFVLIIVDMAVLCILADKILFNNSEDSHV